MDKLQLKETENTPEVSFDHTIGTMRLKGRSWPENTYEFYQPLIKWIEEYKKTPRPNTIFNFELEYFNTSSSKNLLDVLNLLGELPNAGSKLIINWHHEINDNDILSSGKIFSELVEIPFNYIPYKKQ
ncbi:MAG: hypothetical protein A3H98_13785 [Bacteroidetes bacterium RIFCSPLOWO2_02_FULL_36_8]|nr:MAG: hypothetical protein A3H98_13785 [Bacteroidetes bacterium RIFCSPLOWO2_02_FULL_36_8]OFY72002.1 MAG: hypothetical protein A3G23_00205 [Bacteroidetes bacterium RIFCSPLOWO2_12_FULL_37_12]